LRDLTQILAITTSKAVNCPSIWRVQRDGIAVHYGDSEIPSASGNRCLVLPLNWLVFQGFR